MAWGKGINWNNIPIILIWFNICDVINLYIIGKRVLPTKQSKDKKTKKVATDCDYTSSSEEVNDGKFLDGMTHL